MVTILVGSFKPSRAAVAAAGIRFFVSVPGNMWSFQGVRAARIQAMYFSCGFETRLQRKLVEMLIRATRSQASIKSSCGKSGRLSIGGVKIAGKSLSS